jgi:hypothetical protein
VYNNSLVVSDQFLPDISVVNAFSASFSFWLCLPHHHHHHHHHHHQLIALKANQFIQTT